MKFSSKGIVCRLSSKQRLPITMDEAWEVLSNPKNLKVITPSYMSFDIISGADRPMFAGQIIQYIVTPILGVKTTWVTEITHVSERNILLTSNVLDPMLYGIINILYIQLKEA